MSPRFKGDPRVGWDVLEPNWSYLSNFPTWYSKLAHFPIEIPIKNEKWPPNLGYGSIYNSGNRFVGSFYHNTCHVIKEGQPIFWKQPILGHPTTLTINLVSFYPFLISAFLGEDKFICVRCFEKIGEYSAAACTRWGAFLEQVITTSCYM